MEALDFFIHNVLQILELYILSYYNHQHKPTKKKWIWFSFLVNKNVKSVDYICMKLPEGETAYWKSRQKSVQLRFLLVFQNEKKGSDNETMYNL